MASNAFLYIDLEGSQEIREIENRATQTKPSAKANPHEALQSTGRKPDRIRAAECRGIEPQHSAPAKTNPEKSSQNGS